MAAEFANGRRRPLAVALMAMGYPVGGLAGGLLSSALLQHHRWPSIFFAGALAGALLIVVTFILLPESPGYVLSRGRPGELARLNGLLARCGQPIVDRMPTAPAERKRGYGEIFTKDRRATTIRLSLVNLILAGAIYYLLSWLPQMVSDAGFAPARGSLVSAIASLVGVGGALGVGLLAPVVGLKRVALVGGSRAAARRWPRDGCSRRGSTGWRFRRRRAWRQSWPPCCSPHKT